MLIAKWLREQICLHKQQMWVNLYVIVFYLEVVAAIINICDYGTILY